MHSRIYCGQLRHRRHTPVPHVFRYTMFMLYLDLNELPEIFRGRWLWSTTRPALARFRRGDHLGNERTDLADEVRRLARERANIELEGPIRLLTNLRYFGYGFNPVSFYYCFDRHGEEVVAIIAEVNNTPWGERHCYVLSESLNKGSERVKRYLLDKEFHVSPFMSMDINYDWRFTRPARKLVVQMNNYQQGEQIFDATLDLEARPVTGPALAGVLLRYPFMTLKVIIAIYYQALRLWLKNIPFFPHPDKMEAPDPVKKS